MRDILVTIIVMTGCFYTFKRPFVGVYLWSWLIYMNPQRLCYGFALHAPYTQITALVLLGSMLYNKETNPPPVNVITLTWLVFILFMAVTTYFAYFPDKAFIQYLKVIQIQLLVFLTMMLITDTEKLNKLIWVIVLSVGFFTAKGGLYYLLLGGDFNLWGPSGTSIEPPTELAIAGLIVMPMMVYLYKISNDKWVKLGLVTAIVLSILSLIKSQSGAVFFATFVVGVLFLIIKMGYLKALLLLIGLTFSLYYLLSFFMPELWGWQHAMNEQSDHSSMGQINAWKYAYNAAKDNVLGMGFDSWSAETFAKYAPEPENVHAAHSIYFSLLGDHGWIGLTLFLLILFMAWRKLASLIKETAKKQESQEIHCLASLLQYGFIAYLFGGAFANLAYFGLPWHWIAIVMIMTKIVANQPVGQIRRANLASFE
jgi:putative inorganic carbon (hco3(-)) transporter